MNYDLCYKFTILMLYCNPLHPIARTSHFMQDQFPIITKKD
jgi:hypothetical protein